MGLGVECRDGEAGEVEPRGGRRLEASRDTAVEGRQAHEARSGCAA